MRTSTMVENQDRKSKGKHSVASRSVDKKTLGTLIHQKLDEMRHGDLYQIEGFTEKDYKILLSDDEKFNKFVNLLGNSMGSIEAAKNPDTNKKQIKLRSKEIAKALTAIPKIVQKQIKAHQQLIASNPDGQTSSPDQKLCDKTPAFPETDSVTQTGEEFYGEKGNIGHTQESESPPRSSQKQKGKKSNKVKKKKKGKVSKSKQEKLTVENREEVEEEIDEKIEEELYLSTSLDTDVQVPIERPNPAREEAEREFNLAKEDVLVDVDTIIKENFHQIGFSRWSGTWLPIIQLSPYDPPPGVVRNDWMKIFNKVKKKTSLPRMIYWYGTKRDEAGQKAGFSFCQKSSICSYEEGVKNGRNVIPEKTQKKIYAGKKLTDIEVLLVDGLKEQEIELQLAKEDRVDWIKGNEEWELLSDTVLLETEEIKVKGKVSKVNGKVSKVNGKGSKTKGGKVKISTKKHTREEDHEVSVATDQAKKVTRKRKKDKLQVNSNDDEQCKKKTRKSKRYKIVPAIICDDEQEGTVQDADTENLGDGEPSVKKKTKKSKRLKIDPDEAQEVTTQDADTENFGDGELSVRKKTKKSTRLKIGPDDAQESTIQDAYTENFCDGEPNDPLLKESDTNGVDEGGQNKPVEEASKSKKSTKKQNKRKKCLAQQRLPSMKDIKICSEEKEEPGKDGISHGNKTEEDPTFEPSAKKKKKKKKKKLNSKNSISPTSNGVHPSEETKDHLEKNKMDCSINDIVDGKVGSVGIIEVKNPDENRALHETITSDDSADERQSAKYDTEDSAALSADAIKSNSSIANPLETSTPREIKNVESDINLDTDCDSIFIPLKKGLSKALGTDDTYMTKHYLKDIRQNVGSITPLFIREHKLGMLIKKARNKFSLDAELVALARSVTKVMKKEFLKKKNPEKG